MARTLSRSCSPSHRRRYSRSPVSHRHAHSHSQRDRTSSRRRSRFPCHRRRRSRTRSPSSLRHRTRHRSRSTSSPSPPPPKSHSPSVVANHHKLKKDEEEKRREKKCGDLFLAHQLFDEFGKRYGNGNLNEVQAFLCLIMIKTSNLARTMHRDIQCGGHYYSTQEHT
ncbi:hypothetical protein HN51_040461 [Arachis hypogaea]